MLEPYPEYLWHGRTHPTKIPGRTDLSEGLGTGANVVEHSRRENTREDSPGMDSACTLQNTHNLAENDTP